MRGWACETKDYTGCLSDVERSLQLDNSPKQLRMASMTLGTFAAQGTCGPCATDALHAGRES